MCAKIVTFYHLTKYFTSKDAPAGLFRESRTVRVPVVISILLPNFKILFPKPQMKYNLIY